MTAPASQERCEYHTYAYDLTKWYLEGLNTYTPPTERIEVLAEETAVKIVDAWRRNGFIK